MDLPPDDPTPTPATEQAGGAKARAGRRRASSPARAPILEGLPGAEPADEPMPDEPEAVPAAESPALEVPAAERVAAAAPVTEPTVAEAPAPPSLSSAEPVESPAPADQPAADLVSFNPPAAVMADSAKDHPMDTVNTTADTATDTADKMADRGQAMCADMNGRAKDALEKSSRMVEEFSALGKGNMEAMVESSRIAAKCFETLGQEAAEFTRKSMESATGAMRTMATTRSPAELMKLQSDYARSFFDQIVAETSRSTEMLIKLANDVAQPLSNRMAVTAEKMKTVA